MTPSDYYRQKISAGEILPDAQQLKVIEQLDKLHHCLNTPPKCIPFGFQGTGKALVGEDEGVYTKYMTEPESHEQHSQNLKGEGYKSWFSSVAVEFCKKFNRLFVKFATLQPLCQGLYIWGSVGIGKTFLLDTFYYTLPFSQKLRIHFYAFMQQVQNQLRILQGHSNPLRDIARHFASQYRVICFDELMVHDIADAMVLGQLFTALFQEGVCLCFTSNVPPEDLYKNGLQRSRFLPAINEIKAHTRVLQVQITEDYRLQSATQPRYYCYPLTTYVYEQLEQYFKQFSQGEAVHTEPLHIANRTIAVKKWTEGGVAWFEFMAICGIPRNQEDYLAISRRFHTVFISNLWVIGKGEHDLARSFIRLVDVLYDQKTRLIIAAAQPIEQIYPEGLLTFEFARTQSRLQQMQL